MVTRNPITGSRYGGISGFLSSPVGKALLLTALVVLTAGCSGVLSDDGGGAQGPALDDVPEGVNAVMYFDSGVIDDPTTEQLMNGIIEMGEETATDEDTPESWEEALTQFEEESDVDVEAFHNMVWFGDSERMSENGEEYAGGIIQSDWSWEDMQQAWEGENVSFEEDSYNGVTVYVTESTDMEGVDNPADVSVSGTETWVADMGDGKFGVGTEQAVKDIIDTNQGDASSFGGDLRNAYENAPDGYMKMAINMTAEQAEAASSVASSQTGGMGSQSLSALRTMTMTYGTDGDQMQANMQMMMETQEAAEGFMGLTSMLTGMASGEEDQEPSPGESPGQWLASNLEVSQEENTVTMNFAATPDELLTLLEAMDSGPASGQALVGPSQRATVTG